MSQQKQKTELVEEEEIIAEAVIVPPDGGWGWVVVAASFMANVVVDGIIFTAGQGFLPIWAEQFTGGQSGPAAWVVSLLSGFYLLVGPVVSAVANIFGCRITAIAGAIVAAFGFGLSMFATNIYFLYFSFGILGGIGLGLIYLPSIVIVSYYFEKKRAFATGIAVCGSGIGTFLFAPLINFLTDIYPWKLTMLIISGITLQCIVFASLYRNLAPTTKQVHTVKVKLADLAEEKERKLSQTAEKAPVDSQFIAKDVQFERFADANHLNGGQTGAQAQTNRARTISERPYNSAFDLDDRHRLHERKTSAALLGEGSLNKVVSKESITALNRPLSRQDIFYTGSVQNLPQFRSQPDVKHFIASTLSIPSLAQGAGVAPGVETGASTKRTIFATIKSMLDFSMFTSPSFIILALSGFFTLTGFFVPFIYLPKMAESFGHSKGSATFLVSILGITNIVARILCGWLSDRPQVNALIINNVALVLAGLATILVPHFQPYWLLCVYCIIFGMGTACFASLRSVICVELLGLEKLTNAFGLLLLFMGIASLIGSPLAGLLYDLTKNFNLSFYVMGVLVMFSGLIGFPLPYINRWEKRREMKKMPSAVQYQVTGSQPHIPETVVEEAEEEPNA